MDWTPSGFIGLAALVLTIVGLVATWAIRVNTGERADSAAATAHKRLDELKSELGSFKQEVARDYASNRMIEQMESRLVTAIERLGDRLDRAFEVRKP